jgi:hypothetical protein
MTFRKSKRVRRNLRKSRKNRNRYYRVGGRVFDTEPHLKTIFDTLDNNGEDRYKLSRAVISRVIKSTDANLSNRAADIIKQISLKYTDPNDY